MIEEIFVPESAAGRGWDDFEAYVRVRNDVETASLGSGVLWQGAEELLPKFASNPQRIRRLFVARVDGQIVGRAMVTTRPRALGAAADLVVDVLPEYRGRGIGASLLDRIESVAKTSGATVLQCHVVQAARPEVDSGGPFLRAHGYVMEQRARVSVLDLASFTRPDFEVSGDFRIHVWRGPTPDAWLDGVAHLRTRMSIDPPTADMVVVPDEWDAVRIVEHDAREVATGRQLFTAAVEHRLSAALVGFTELAAAPGGGVAMQGATLVLREHRGHRLGLLLKAAAVESLLEHEPPARQVVTFNAEENRPMLTVNEALGYRAIGVESAWQKVTSQSRE